MVNIPIPLTLGLLQLQLQPGGVVLVGEDLLEDLHVVLGEELHEDVVLGEDLQVGEVVLGEDPQLGEVGLEVEQVLHTRMMQVVVVVQL